MFPPRVPVSMVKQTYPENVASYRLRARAAAMDRTRQRITQAAIELHGTIGPAATTMSAVAEKAGVTRATLYRHFANEDLLFTACSADWLAANPRPDLARWAAIEDPARDSVSRSSSCMPSTGRPRRCGRTSCATSMRCRRGSPLGSLRFRYAMRDVLAVGWPSDGMEVRRARTGPRDRVRDVALADPRGPRRQAGREADGRVRQERDLRSRATARRGPRAAPPSGRGASAARPCDRDAARRRPTRSAGRGRRRAGARARG